MTEWTREERYQRIEDVDTEYFKTLKQQVDQSKFRQQFHIQPETGLLNDPNGLIFYKGKYYVSHQWFPLGAVHGLKYWYNYTSDDLINFKAEGPILNPDTKYDSHGVYSGSAFEYNGHLYYMYTGNHRDNHWQRHASQMIARLKEDGSVEKFPKPVISQQPEGYTSHFRDPKVFKYSEKYYAIIGAQNNDQQGRLLLYNTEDIINWHYLGEINTELDDFGYMWECPDYFNVDNQDVILICQKGRRVLIGWMGLPEIEYPTDNEGWAHCLTIPRVLNVENGQLKQRPYPALEKLRHNKETALGYANKFTRKLHPYEGKQYELIIDILDNDATEVYFELRTSKTSSTLIAYNKRENKITLDRSDSGLLPTNVEGTSRSTILDTPLKQLQIFVDTSSIEIFCNDGERVLTSRIFPTEDALGIKTSTESGQVYLQFTKYDLKDEHK